jgi:hypothetical protein
MDPIMSQACNHARVDGVDGGDDTSHESADDASHVQDAKPTGRLKAGVRPVTDSAIAAWWKAHGHNARRTGDGRTFVQHDDHVAGVKFVQAKGQQEEKVIETRIAAGVIGVTDVVKVRGIDHDNRAGTASEGITYTVIYAPPGDSTPAVGTTVEDSDLRQSRNPEWPGRLGIDPYAGKAGLSDIPDVIRANALPVPKGVAYNATGLLTLTGEAPVFLRAGAPALTGHPARFADHYRTALGASFDTNPGLRHLTLADPSTDDQAADDWWAMHGLCEITSDGSLSVPAVLIGQVESAPWSTLPGVGHAAVFLSGTTGAMKTTIGGLGTGIQSATFTPVQGESAAPVMSAATASTVASRGILHRWRGHVIPIDDFLPKQITPVEIAAHARLIDQIGRGVREGTADVKARIDGSDRPGKVMRAVPMLTGERFVDPTSSAAARYVHVPMPVGGLDGPGGLAAAQASVRAMARAHSRMICAGLADPAWVKDIAGRADFAVRGWGIPGNPHLATTYQPLVLGLRLFAVQGERLGVQSTDATFGPLLEAVRELAFRQGEASAPKSRLAKRHGQHVAEVVATLRKLLRARTWRVDGERIGMPPAVPDASPEMFGWTEKGVDSGGGIIWVAAGQLGDPIGHVHTWKPGQGGRPPTWPVRARSDGSCVLRIKPDDFTTVYDAIRGEVDDGEHLPGEDAMRAALAKAGYLKSKDAVSPGHGAKGRVLYLDLARVLAGEDGADDQGDDQGEPAGQAPEPDPAPVEDEPRACQVCGVIWTGAAAELAEVEQWTTCASCVPPITTGPDGLPEVCPGCRGHVGASRETRADYGGWHIGCAPADVRAEGDLRYEQRVADAAVTLPGIDAIGQDQGAAAPTPAPPRARPALATGRPAWMPGKIRRTADGEGYRDVIATVNRLLAEQEMHARIPVLSHPYPVGSDTIPGVLKLRGRGRGTGVHEGKHSWFADLPEGTRVIILDRNAAFLAAIGTALLPIGPVARYDGRGPDRQVGVHRLESWPETTADGPHPLGQPTVDRASGPLWIPTPTLQLADQAAAAGVITAPVVVESWTAPPLQPGKPATTRWEWVASQVGAVRDRALAEGDAQAAGFLKPLYSCLVSTAGESTGNTALWRPELPPIFRGMAAANLYRVAAKLQAAGVKLAAITGTDEIHTVGTAEDVWSARTADGKPVVVEGKSLSQIKVKGGYTVGPNGTRINEWEV